MSGKSCLIGCAGRGVVYGVSLHSNCIRLGLGFDTEAQRTQRRKQRDRDNCSMSQTLYVEFEGDGFWAYDVGVGVFLKYLIDVARAEEEQQSSKWLDDCIKHWRVNAVVSDFGLWLDPEWTDDQRRIIRSLIDTACLELENSDSISAEEAASWQILDGCGVYSRGAETIATAPAIELGRAISLLLEGKLPKAPFGYWWLYGVEGGVSTIKKRE
jgi:hypothetical protein